MNRKELAKRFVTVAVGHDSILPQEHKKKRLVKYIPGGKDNATAAVFAPKKADPDDLEL